MDLDFVRGDSTRPRGHALVYFETDEPPKVLVTYLIVPPITLDFKKYVPPMLAGRLPVDELKSMSAFPLPPVPEEMPDVAHVERLAALRDDDLIRGGRVSTTDLMVLMQLTATLGQRYYEGYTIFVVNSPEPEPESPEVGTIDVSEVLLQLMGEPDKVAELAKLAGKLRYAVEGNDADLIAETKAEVERLGRYLPGSYQVDRFLAAALTPGMASARLTQLYVERCYALARQDYDALRQIDTNIAEAEPR